MITCANDDPVWIHVRHEKALMVLMLIIFNQKDLRRSGPATCHERWHSLAEGGETSVAFQSSEAMTSNRIQNL